MSAFSEERKELFDRFVSYRQSCNMWNSGYGSCLLYFDRYCSEHFPGESGVTQDMINGWCTQRATENKSSLISRTLPARKLIEYANGRGLTNIIIPEMPHMPPKSYIPHAFLGAELTAFFDECNRWVKSAKTPDKQFRALQSSVIFRLLYSSGIRTTEARLLRVIDVDLQDGVLNIRKTKASIEHYVALHDSATRMLCEYDAIARKFFPERELFFPNNGKDPYRADTLTYDFRKIWDRVNDENAVPYDLRHNYATCNINSWIDAGYDFNDKLVYLSKSMGHTSLESTMYYYSFVPELASILQDKTESGFNEIVPEVPHEE